MKRLRITSPQYLTIFKRIMVGLVIVSILGYTTYQLQNLVSGPELIISNPTAGTSQVRLVTLTGKAKRANNVTVNGYRLFTNESDEFSHPLLLLAGYNIITVQATDRFGKDATQKITVVGPTVEPALEDY